MCCTGEFLRKCFLVSDISPADLDALWTEPPYTLDAANEIFTGNDIMTTGEEEEVEPAPELDSYWKRKEAFDKGSTVSLAVGERFSSDVLLQFSGRWRSSAEPNTDLQEALRTRLRVVESNSQDVAQLFKDLSARLLSVHAEKDCFVITFKTIEEIWKFSTYLALGYVARCLENFLCDQSFWLDSPLLSDVEICVTVDEEHLATLYLGLLLQEGTFFSKALYDSKYTEEEDLPYKKNDLVMVKDTGQDATWEGSLLATGQHGLVPVHAMQPLPYPFYQWFLRKYPGSAGGAANKGPFVHRIARGTCVAVVDHDPIGQDELRFSKGDLIQVEGFLLASLDLFVGRHLPSGLIGFVQKAHVKAESLQPLDGQLVFLSENERATLAHCNPCTEQSYSALLNKLSATDISTVYRLDRLDKSDFTYIKNQPKQEQKSPICARQSTISEKSASPFYQSSPRSSIYASQSQLEKDGEMLSFSLDDTFKEMDEFEEDPQLFMDDSSWEAEEAELYDPIMSLLNQDHFQETSQAFCDMSYSFLETTFRGYTEDELLLHLENVREGAKKSGMQWAHRRACFLMGRLCAKKNKYSQARVYFEEALSMPVKGFADPPLLVALYTNLTAVYLKQRQLEKLSHTLEKASTLLLCLPEHEFCSIDEFEVLKLLIRKAIVESDKYLEARTCYLIVKLFLRMRKVEDTLPFVERLQFLTISLSTHSGSPLAPVDLNWMLSRLYHKKYLPYLTLASLSLDSISDRSLQDAFQKIDMFIKNSVRLNPQWRDGTSVLPAQVVVYLQQALSIASHGDDIRTQRDLCLGLTNVYQQHGALEKAVQCTQRAVQMGGHLSEEGGFEATVLLAWLLVLRAETERASDTLQPLLQSLNETDSPTQCGVVHNILGLCLRHGGQVQEAASNFHRALQISQENGNKRNEGLVLANIGCLALSIGAPALAERFLLRSLRLFPELSDTPTDAEHVQAYLWLGRSYRDRGKSQEVRLCYEMALLIAIGAKNLHSQIVVAKELSRLYADMLLYGQCIIYCEHCVQLAQELKDKKLEGEFLEMLSNLYLSLNTEKSSRKSLDYTKQSLRISIDLGKREEESETWLQVGRIYYLIQEDELADMYLQAAVKTALRMHDACFAGRIYEEAGDVFFTGLRNRAAAFPFYRDGSLPFARGVKDMQAEFRLLSKITELLLDGGQYEEALQYALLAVEVSTATGVCQQERVAFHRLATVYFSLQRFELAENYYLKALSLSSAILEHPKEARYFVKVYCRLGAITLHQLKDAIDAKGYFHLALAAALEDQDNARALYVIYMKLAEIHANYIPDEELSQSYRDSATALREELAIDTDTA
uniref:SH3 domain and tetratricopeptide repeats 2 n=1 Tax=Paramormyrops kingsleyae TaxID=1676925 RepID=A0A3B3RXX4_9TELE|nr:SH3 domain and tetratricopeptide repeat-containing protein 2 isoform X1 [Paramormyrops kingsleyae]